MKRIFFVYREEDCLEKFLPFVHKLLSLSVSQVSIQSAHNETDEHMKRIFHLSKADCLIVGENIEIFDVPYIKFKGTENLEDLIGSIHTVR